MCEEGKGRGIVNCHRSCAIIVPFLFCLVFRPLMQIIILRSASSTTTMHVMWMDIGRPRNTGASSSLLFSQASWFISGSGKSGKVLLHFVNLEFHTDSVRWLLWFSQRNTSRFHETFQFAYQFKSHPFSPTQPPFFSDFIPPSLTPSSTMKKISNQTRISIIQFTCGATVALARITSMERTMPDSEFCTDLFRLFCLSLNCLKN